MGRGAFSCVWMSVCLSDSFSDVSIVDDSGFFQTCNMFSLLIELLSSLVSNAMDCNLGDIGGFYLTSIKSSE
jgi:hypothetical protein